MGSNEDYTPRRRALQKKFELLAHGARANCSYDIRVHPTRVGEVINGKYISTIILGLIEMWYGANASAFEKREK